VEINVKDFHQKKFLRMSKHVPTSGNEHTTLVANEFDDLAITNIFLLGP
jgi:hypothetical protein